MQYKHVNNPGAVYEEATSTFTFHVNGREHICWAVFCITPSGALWMTRYTPEQWAADIAAGILTPADQRAESEGER